MSEKLKGVILDAIVYTIAFAIGLIFFMLIDDMIIASLTFTAIATAIIFIVTCFIPDTSIYDPYWSVAPLVIILCDVIKYNLYNINSLLVGIVFIFWSFRLTLNWYYTYKGICHEDWRYKMYREKLNKVGFFFINMIGLQFVPTFVVFASLIPALILISNVSFNPLIIIGLVISVLAVILEIIADRTIHRFIREKTKPGSTCNVGVWKYSRHPNYLGEITF